MKAQRRTGMHKRNLLEYDLYITAGFVVTFAGH